MTAFEAPRRVTRRDVLMMAGGVVIALVAFASWRLVGGEEPDVEAPAAAMVEPADASAAVRLAPDVLQAAGIEVSTVGSGPRIERVTVPGVIQPNELQTQDVTPLVSGRVERVLVVEGSAVSAGSLLLTMSSPEVAELQGHLRAAEARVAETDATLSRTGALVELGAGAGKDLIAAESAQAAAGAEAAQLRQRLETLGASAATDAAVSSVVSIRAPSSATVLERLANPGQWIAAGTPLLTLADLSTVWVVANVPEGRLPAISVSAPAEVTVAALDGLAITGRVSYIESRLDDDTRTAPVRIELANPGRRLRIGMFVVASIEGRRTGGEQLTVPVSAIQRIGERTVVFVPLEEAGAFDVRDVQVGDEVQGTVVIVSGLEAGERVVSAGGFTLKSQLLKGQFGEDEELAGGAEP